MSARLGIAVAKKTVAGAAKRTRIKRAVRESFRLNRPRCRPWTSWCRRATRPGQRENGDLRASLDWHWQELIKRCKES